MAINFNQAGSFNGVQGEAKALNNPTSIQFGPDGRLYVAEQNGTINAFTVENQNGEYVATANEELLLSNGAEVVKSIQNHNDDGSLSSESNRQVTGIVVTGTAENPVLYVSSSDPRIASFEDTNLDTNSGVVTQLTWNGTEWEAVDIVRGLPRSEENHSVNGMVLSEDGTELYLMVGGNTNNGAPSDFFAYTGEYALSGTVLEIDLEDIASRPILNDPVGGQGGTSRQYVYDLPTLDDPTTSNISDGVGEDISGLDENGPWGGNDGFNMAILPADAPMSIFADGLRNQYDIVLTGNGQFYTVDNGSNGNLGGNPVDISGVATDQPNAGEATNTPNNGGTGDPEPLFLLEDGGYYGHPAPSRSNQDLSWTVFNDDGNPDATLSPNSVASLSDLVPDGVDIADGFLIDPSKFTSNSTRLAQSGIRIERDSAASNALITLGSSSNGLVEYTDDVFGGGLQGSLIVTQFNGNVTLLNLSDDGTSIEPLTDPTEGNAIIDDDGIFPLATGQSNPLDVTTGPDGTIWVAEFGPDNINIFAPSDEVEPTDSDFDDDGIINVNDPFIRDGTNGGSVFVSPGQNLLWDFDADQDGNLPGLDGYGGGLTGVMVDGNTDFEEFFQEPSTLPGQIVKLDNVKFNTAAGGGTTVVEFVSNGDPFESQNNGEYLFHTGVTVAPTVETFKIKWSVFNPGTDFTGSFQQIGGYIGTGDQSNYLKIVAIEGFASEVQIVLEDNNVVQSISFIEADDLFNFPTDQQIFFELEIDPTAGIATPTVSYETSNENVQTVTGEAIDLNGTNVLDAIQGNYTVDGQDSGLAVGLFSSNTGQPAANTFQAVFNDIEITATGDTSETILYRVNAGGAEIAATDGGIAWSADTPGNNSPFLSDPGSNNTASFPAVEPGANIPNSVPDAIFDTERWDQPGGSEMQWAFDVPEEGPYEVRLYLGNGFDGTNDPGERIFDVAIEGSVPNNLDDIDLIEQFGHQTGGVISNIVTVTDGTIDLEFIHGAIENPLVNGIEIVQLGGNGNQNLPTVSIVCNPYVVSEDEDQIQISLLTDLTVPNDETVNVTFEIVPGTATALEDYEYQSTTATFNEQTGIYTDTVAIAGSSSDATFLIDILPDAIAEADEAFTVNIIDVSPNAQIGTDSASVTIQDNNSTQSGAAVLSVTADSDNVQISNFGSNSFQIANTGDKKITQIEIDVSNALYPDTVFDPFGEAGDTVAKELTIDTEGGTGVVAAPGDTYLGTGGTAGFEAIQLTFDENVDSGFESGETVGFSVDMDPNSIAGAEKSPLDQGSNPSWDVGGVSGAELIGSTFTVTFDDDTTATGQLQGAGNQAGSQALATQDVTDVPITLTVNNLEAGEVGTYNENGLSVIINGPAGQTARVVLTKGFIQPISVDPFLNGTVEQQEFAPVLQSQLDALAASDFPANNAVEFQTVDVELTGTDQDITELFDFSQVTAFNFQGENQVPLGFVASAIDPTNDNLPIGTVTQPIYLQFDTNNNPGSSETIIYRVNAGGAEIAATDGDIAWSADTASNNSPFLSDPGSNNTASFPVVGPGANIPDTVPDTIYDTERWDQPGGSEMQWAFDVPEEGLYEVRLYMGNGFSGTNDPGERIFDVAIEGSVPDSLNDIDLSEQFGHQIGGVIINTVMVSDGTLNLEFVHSVENPLINGIEIVQLDEQTA
ncbi:MAG: malectin domain-containing carbohydrate-binding protein [Cyanobacteria bacterium P01_G01_bin.19]